MFSELSKILKDHKNEIEAAIAEDFLVFLKFSINANTLGLVPLAPYTVKNKKSAVPLLDTREYLNNIIVEKNKVKVRNGVHKSGLSYEALAIIHEYGRLDLGIPARPAWYLAVEKYTESGRSEKVMLDVLKRRKFVV